MAGTNRNGGAVAARPQSPARQDDPIAEGEARGLDLAETSMALGEITRAEIEAQVATARRYPRSIRKALDDATTLATYDPRVAGRCTYALPRGGKTISGPSVRLAEIMASCWGNLRTASRVVGDDGRFLTIEAVCIDLEKNNGVAVQVRRRITNRGGDRFNDDMINTTANAAVSIGLRNAIFRVIPFTFVDIVWASAKDTVAGGAGGFIVMRDKWLGFFGSRGVDAERVCRGLGVGGVDDLKLEHIATFTAIENALEDGEARLDDLFPPFRVLDALPGRNAGESATQHLTRTLKGQREAKAVPLRSEAEEYPPGSFEGDEPDAGANG